jgi:signal transduction histidine kinase
LYPESFANQKNREIITLDDYSYGIYASNKLISQLGEFPYQLHSIPDENQENLFFGGVKHTRYSNSDYEVILSIYANPFRQILTIFTFILIIIIFIGILGSLLLRIFSVTNQQITHTFLPDLSHHLSSRIQVAITVILIFGLLLSVYTIVHFEKSNYNAMLEEQLLNKVKNISSRLQNRVNLSEKLSNEEQRLLILNEESNTHQVDINLFDKYGKLLGSSKPSIVDNQILGSQMNPIAYNKLNMDKTSQLLIQEELEGSDYLSAYVPLFNGRNEVIGYVNTPLFSKNELLNKQLSNLIINIINVYFLLLIVGGFIAYFISKEISKPLEIIREKIAKTVLRGSNELINYNRDDEIGQLVKQYNKMAIELQERAQQIANSEREGAWKEMAKQVAHEIKNPLTPMKLSIQHLQRSIENDSSDKQRELTKKTSILLLKQIESLSIMAEQFSSFAQMPQDQFNAFNLSDITYEVVSLFKQEKNTQIKSEIQKHIFLWADSEQIKRVLINIIKNAIQAIPDDIMGQIKVSLTSKKNIQIEISDNGIGISTENHPNIFAPNFSTKNSGMGLGLALSKKIIENSGGQIQFKSVLNKGTTFYITLPIYNYETP